MMQELFRGLPLAVVLALSAAPALAHAQLQSAIPAVGGSVRISPPVIQLTFSEGVEPHFSSIALAASGGGAIPLGQAKTTPGDARVLVSAVPGPLKPGTYTVTWHAVSVDTHRTQGSFDFTFEP